jgi:hypothetical protein
MPWFFPGEGDYPGYFKTGLSFYQQKYQPEN